MNKTFSIFNSAALFLLLCTWHAAAATTNVSYGFFFFNPPVVQILARDTVNWTGGTGHTLVGTGADPICGGGSLPCSYTFNTPGIYPYKCTVDGHASLGMTGSIIVVAVSNLRCALSRKPMTADLVRTIGLESLTKRL